MPSSSDSIAITENIDESGGYPVRIIDYTAEIYLKGIKTLGITILVFADIMRVTNQSWQDYSEVIRKG